jgi:hypothetical protein
VLPVVVVVDVGYVVVDVGDVVVDVGDVIVDDDVDETLLLDVPLTSAFFGATS